MDRDELEAIANSFLEAFNSNDRDRYEALLTAECRVDEKSAGVLTTSRAEGAARFAQIQDALSAVVGTVQKWIVDPTNGTVAAEVVWTVPDERLPDLTGTLFLSVEDGHISSISEQHVRPQVPFFPGCPVQQLPLGDDS